MTPPNSLTALAERIERLTGPCRETDAAICLAIKRPQGIVRAPAYTASLDAAMTLVPEGFRWKCGYSRHVPHQADLTDYKNHTGRYDGNSDYSRAHALVAASLRARAASESPHAR